MDEGKLFIECTMWCNVMWRPVKTPWS